MKTYWKTIATASLICVLCFIPMGEIKLEKHFSFADKVVHCTMFFVLTVISCIDYQQHTYRHSLFARILLCVVFPVLLGGGIEFVQEICCPTRSGDLYDWFFDVIGVAVGFVCMAFFQKIKFKKNDSY